MNWRRVERGTMKCLEVAAGITVILALLTLLVLTVGAIAESRWGMAFGYLSVWGFLALVVVHEYASRKAKG